MESIRVETEAGRCYDVTIQEVRNPDDKLVRTLIDIDLQTFAESTFSFYMAAALLQHGSVYLLKAEEVVIGTCVCVRDWGTRYEAVMLSMGIRPGWRGQGLGQAFVDGVVSRLRARGVRGVSLLVGSGNSRAIRVYEDVGFVTVDERAVCDSRSGERFVRMRCELQDDAPVTAL